MRKKDINRELDEIALFVIKARESMNLTQDQLADLMSCTKGNVSAWENGRHHPSYLQLCTLSKRARVPLPHDDKSSQLLAELNIAPDNITVNQEHIVREPIKVKEENTELLKSIVEKFAQDSGADGKKSSK